MIDASELPTHDQALANLRASTAAVKAARAAAENDFRVAKLVGCDYAAIGSVLGIRKSGAAKIGRRLGIHMLQRQKTLAVQMAAQHELIVGMIERRKSYNQISLKIGVPYEHVRIYCNKHRLFSTHALDAASRRTRGQTEVRETRAIKWTAEMDAALRSAWECGYSQAAAADHVGIAIGTLLRRVRVLGLPWTNLGGRMDRTRSMDDRVERATA